MSRLNRFNDQTGGVLPLIKSTDNSAEVLNSWAKEINKQLYGVSGPDEVVDPNLTLDGRLKMINDKMDDMKESMTTGFNNKIDELKEALTNLPEMSNLVKSTVDKVDAIQSQLARLETSMFGEEQRRAFKKVLMDDLSEKIAELKNSYPNGFNNQLKQLQSEFRGLGTDNPNTEDYANFTKQLVSATNYLDQNVSKIVPPPFSEMSANSDDVNELMIKMNDMDSEINTNSSINSTNDVNANLIKLQEVYKRFKDGDGTADDAEMLRQDINLITQQLSSMTTETVQQLQSQMKDQIKTQSDVNKKLEQLQSIYQKVKNGDVNKVSALRAQIDELNGMLRSDPNTPVISGSGDMSTLKMKDKEDLTNATDVNSRLLQLQKTYKDFQQGIVNLEKLRGEMDVITAQLAQNEAIKPVDMPVKESARTIKGKIASELLKRTDDIPVSTINQFMKDVDSVVDDISNGSYSEQDINKRIDEISGNMLPPYVVLMVKGLAQRLR